MHDNAPRVTLQVGELAEGLGAAGVAALVGLVARVRPDVLLQVGQLRELALADLASERREPSSGIKFAHFFTMLGMCSALSARQIEQKLLPKRAPCHRFC